MSQAIVVVNKTKCNPINCGDYLCMRFCPRNRAGDECIIKGPEGKVVINEEVCISCSICVKKCPFKALSVINKPTELKQEPVHQYGINAFRLYGLPIPKKNSIIGLIGANGIGKTTAISILSGELKPNLGRISQPPNSKELLNHFQGSETNQYLKDLFDGKKSIAYKPQYVESIPKAFKGTVRELLKKVNSNYEKLSNEMEVNNILDTPINNISGGELQRVAITACLLKGANTYFFDEPSSYLDIKQRLSIAKKLSKLKSNDNTVFIVEHDLIMLDYMTEQAHIFYGKNSVYGITSYPYTTREAINAYLNGYLQNENMKFRDKPITYDIKAEEQSIKRTINNSWNKMSKKLGNFELTINQGSIYEGETIGVLGANGTGKTTFARILAGELKTDTGEVNSKLKISYKPQYIKPENNITVKELLNTNPLYHDYKQYFNHLSIESLMNKKLQELSGGELQRVAVTNCLTKDADIYLLDEPSAHLDVEQRIQAAKAIKDIIMLRKKNAVIIDHDLMLIDYLSERLLIFKGTPGIKAETTGPLSMRDGMNTFLKDLGITFRRDETSKRPRPNKEESVKDREQKNKNEYYYA